MFYQKPSAAGTKEPRATLYSASQIIRPSYLKRTLNTVKDATHDTGTELHGQGLAGAEHGVTNDETG